MIIKSLQDIEDIKRFESKPFIIDKFYANGYQVTEFLLDGTLNVIVKKQNKIIL